MARGVCALLVIAAIVGAVRADAAQPGENGLIALGLVRSGGGADVIVVNPDGTGQRQLTSTAPNVWSWTPAWSPDGRRLAFSSNRGGNFDIYTMNADGTDVRQVTTDPANEEEPSWSPDGRRILFRAGVELVVVDSDGNNRRGLGPGYNARWWPDGTKIVLASQGTATGDIFVMNTNGGARRNLTNSAANELSPDVSPDGRRIVFARSSAAGEWDVWTMAADGGDERQLTSSPGYDWRTAWSPDGQRIVFDSSRGDGTFSFDVFTMAADGSDVRRVTDVATQAVQPAWQPLPRTLDLAVAGRAVPRQGKVGRNVTLAIIVRNRGGSAATGATLTVSLPRTLRTVSARGAGATCTRAAVVTCRWATLAGAASATVVVRPLRPGVATATASAFSLDADPALGNNRARVRVLVRR